MDNSEVAVLMDTSSSAWPLSLRVPFRFLFCYFFLYCLPESGRVNLIDLMPGGTYLTQPYVSAWHKLAPWIAINIFHLSGAVTTYFRTGSGDTTLSYIQNLCYLVLALVATLVWSLTDHRRKEYRVLHSWLRVVVRYTLMFTLLSYGFGKVFPLQFQPPRLAQMVQPYGQFSPMGVLWSFMGVSTAYIIFSGAAELAGGLLLLFRRTTSLGALVSFAVLLNIFVLNLCYDVPVKLYSLNLLLMAIFLLAPDLRRLFGVLVLNRPSAPVDLSLPRFSRRWVRLTALACQVLFVGWFLLFSIVSSWTAYQWYYVNRPHPPLYGLYEVEAFSRNGEELPALVTDTTRWRKVIIEYPTAFDVRMMDDSPRHYGATYTTGKNIVTLEEDQGNTYPFTYQRLDEDHVLLQGTLADDSLSVRLRRIDPSKFLLVNRGFHWISEYPYNR
jgi:uncharacterized membrane protein YphA (DoxX/SURF4 family)